MSHVSASYCPPPSRVPLNASQNPEATSIVELERLWPRLPASCQQSIGATLAQMIARQMAAMHSPLFQEENDD